jgi:hypothetical protein
MEGTFQEAGMVVEGRQTLMLRQRFPSEQDADGTMSIPGYMISLEPGPGGLTQPSCAAKN